LWPELAPTAAPPLAGFVVVVGRVVVAALVGEVVDDSPVVEDVDVGCAGARAVLGDVLADVCAVLDWEEPPHPPINRKTGIRPARIERLLTFSA
jgi:hypothetical protein